MTKKIDIKRTLGKPTAPLSIEDVEAMTRLIHNKTDASTPSVPEENPKMNVAKTIDLLAVDTVETLKYEETTVKPNVKNVQQNVVQQSVGEVQNLSNANVKTDVKTDVNAKKRGRKPKMLIETERLLRVSVDLPESLFIQLKIVVIQQQTDMKTYIRQLVEKDRLSS